MKNKSKYMTELYGEKGGEEVFQILENIDPNLNDVIQTIAYDQFWSRPGLSTRDKSLVTIAALVAMGKETQLKIHINGFLNSGGSLEDLKNTLIHLAVYCGFPATMNGFKALKDIIDQ